ncbi:hypothetical protein ISS05_04290 [Candidatus Woesearchaeota archaeon]|nr:hypothetical protein [Candidatus Woesearchaeota archaeon]
MNQTIKKDILSILSDTITILRDKETVDLKELSNHTIHNASIFQDEDSVSIAILIYSLSKVIERKPGKLDFKLLSNLLNLAWGYLKKDDTAEYRKSIKKLFNLISKIDSRLKLYMEEVIRQAQIKKGSQLYRHGISLARASEILGISQWELMNYIGHTKITEIEAKADIRSRLDFTRGLFS